MERPRWFTDSGHHLRTVSGRAFPDFRVEITNLIESGDTVIAEGIYTMTHEGEFDGIPPTGRDVEIRAVVKFLIEDGKIQEHWEYHDRQEMLEQLGVTGAE